MTCQICDNDILSNQMRHSDGLGNYHILCEFDAERKALGLPLMKDVKKVKFISGFSKATVTPTGSRREDARAIDTYRFSWEKVAVS